MIKNKIPLFNKELENKLSGVIEKRAELNSDLKNAIKKADVARQNLNAYEKQQFLYSSCIPLVYLKARNKLCEKLQFDFHTLPFAGELFDIAPDSAFKEAGQRVFRSLALSILVPEQLFQQVSLTVSACAAEFSGIKLRFLPVFDTLSPCAAEQNCKNSFFSRLIFRDEPETETAAKRLKAYLAQPDNQIFLSKTPEDLFGFASDTSACDPQNSFLASDGSYLIDCQRDASDPDFWVLGWDSSAKITLMRKALSQYEKNVTDLTLSKERFVKEQDKLQNQANCLSLFIEYSKDRMFRDFDIESARHDLNECSRKESDFRSTHGNLNKISELVEKYEKDKKKKTKDITTLTATNQNLDRENEEFSSYIKELKDRVWPDFSLLKNFLKKAGDKDTEKNTIAGSLNHPDKSDTALALINMLIKKKRNELQQDANLSVEYGEIFGEFKKELGNAGDGLSSDPRCYKECETLLNKQEQSFSENELNDVRNTFAHSTLDCLASLSSSLDGLHTLSKNQISTVNDLLAAYPYEGNKCLYIDYAEADSESRRIFEKNSKELLPMRYIPDEKWGEEQTKECLSAFMKICSLFDVWLPDGRKSREEILNPGKYFNFRIKWFNREDPERKKYSFAGKSGSGGETKKIAISILGLCLASHAGTLNSLYDSAPAFLCMDEAFQKLSHDNRKYMAEFFDKLGFQLILASPDPLIYGFEKLIGTHYHFKANEDENGLKRTEIQDQTIKDYVRKDQESNDAVPGSD